MTGLGWHDVIHVHTVIEKTIHDECVEKRARLRVSVIPSGLGGLTQTEIRKRAIGKRNP